MSENSFLQAAMLIFLIFLVIGPHSCFCGRYERLVLNDIFTNYEVDERPVLEDTDNLHLKLGLTLQQIMDVDEKNQYMKTNVWLTYKWLDQHLLWDPLEYGNVTSVRVASKRVWKPDVLLHNSVNENVNTFYEANVIIQNTGEIAWLPPGIVTSTCKIKIGWFPFDAQECHMKFGTWAYDGRFVNISIGDLDTSTYTPSGEWHLLNLTAIRNTKKYHCCPEVYYDILFIVSIRRRTLYYGLNLIIPTLLISQMTLFDFILPPDSGEKLTLGITIFMSLCVFLIMVSEALPPTSDAVPLIGVYFCSVMLVISLSQISTVLVLNFHNRRSLFHRMPNSVRKLFLHWLPYVLLMRRPGYVMYKWQMVKKSDVQLCNAYIRNGGRNRNSATDQIESKSLLANIDNADVRDDTLKRINLFNNRSSHKTYHDYNDNIPLRVTEGFSNLELLLEALLTELQMVTHKMRNDERESAVMHDWKFAAMVMDRLCLITFFIFYLLLICGIIFAAPIDWVAMG